MSTLKLYITSLDEIHYVDLKIMAKPDGYEKNKSTWRPTFLYYASYLRNKLFNQNSVTTKVGRYREEQETIARASQYRRAVEINSTIFSHFHLIM